LPLSPAEAPVTVASSRNNSRDRNSFPPIIDLQQVKRDLNIALPPLVIGPSLVVHQETLLRAPSGPLSASPVDDRRKRQTSPATPAEPGNLLLDVRKQWLEKSKSENDPSIRVRSSAGWPRCHPTVGCRLRTSGLEPSIAPKAPFRSNRNGPSALQHGPRRTAPPRGPSLR
jgi:hypothetical protein